MTHRSATPERILDEKDRIIRKLKAEVLPYRQQEQSLPLLDQTYRAVAQKYKALQHEKLVTEAQNKTRLDNSARTISELKSELEFLKNQQREILLQLNDFSADNNTLRVQLQKCNNEIDRLKAEANNLLNQNQQLSVESGKLQLARDQLADDNFRTDKNNQSLNFENNDVTLKLGDTKRYIGELATDKKYLYDKIVSLEDSNNQLDANIVDRAQLEQTTLLEVRKRDDLIRQQIEHLIELENKTKKVRAEIFYKNNVLKSQMDKSVELTTQSKYAQRTLNQLHDRITDCDRECREIAKENEDIIRLNTTISADMGSCQSHVQNLFLHNEYLNRELEKFAEEDQFIQKIVIARRGLRPLGEMALKSSKVTIA